ncbi:MAG: hypothetical protein IKV54_06330 [Clostridia bacterium]|nr:hypothetical protein [Clostridia bacterium]
MEITMNLLGIDVGTTSLKAAAFDSDGKLLASATVDYTLITENGFIEFEPEEYVNICRQAIGEIEKTVKIDALAIDTQGETLILTDENGTPVRRAIVWLDNRAEAEAKAIEEAFGAKRVYEVTGQPEITAGWPASKLLWVKNNEPEVFRKTKRIFMLEDYLIYKLSGEFASEGSMQSSTIYFDINTGDWWDEMLDFIGITRENLPRLVKSGQRIGTTPEGITVSGGALDQIAGAIGAGIIHEHEMSEMTGTIMAICAVTDKLPPFDPESKVPCHYHAIDGKYCLLLWSPTAGMALKWYRNTFCPDVSFRELDELAEKVAPGCEGLTMLPYLCGSTIPNYNPSAQGVFFGMTLAHGRGHFARSILESVAFMLKNDLEYLGDGYDTIKIMGGGAMSPLWCRIKADVTGKTLTTLKNTETACLGSAILAGVGAGEFSSIEEAVEKLVETDLVYTPSGDDYGEAYERFNKLDDRLNNWKGGLWQ